ncbi:MalY/PatB family protein [Propionibacteriaceae bacterium Y2011]|uniref:MalY/PatB family protein n=1 Tax=Microlunatus sp. Y2014 TaxID=3418488 RepID=UPI003B4A5CC3
MEILGLSAAALRSSRTSEKWASYGDGVLPLVVAEMDAHPCPDVVEVATAMVRRGDTGYVRPTPDLGNALAQFAHREWGWPVDLTGHRVVPDVMTGIRQLILAATPPRSPVVVSPPCYSSFHGLINSIERPVVTAPLGPDARLDLDAVDHAFAKAGPGAAYILCNPQNPTGTLHTAAELTMVAELADRHGTLVISDEIHAPLVRRGETFVPYLSLPAASRGLALHSASKAFNLAGLRAAVLLAGTRTRHLSTGLHPSAVNGAQHLAVAAQQAAWSADGTWLDQLRGELDDRRALLARLVADKLPGIVHTAGPATYLAWWDCAALGLADPAAHFLTEARVATVAGRHFSEHHDQWIRVNYATSPDILVEAVDRMAAALPV